VRPLRLDETNLCLAIREQQNQGYLPDGTMRLNRGGERMRHFMGTSTFAECTVMPEIALAKIDPAPRWTGPACSPAASRPVSARRSTPRRSSRARRASSSRRLVGLGAVAGCRLQGADRIVAIDLSEDRLALARGQGRPTR